MDIFNLKKSKTREKILRHYFANPGKKYYLRELERILSLPVGNIRRELLVLEKSGIFNRGKVGNQVYYYINSASPVFEEFKNIISKTFQLRENKKTSRKGKLILIEKSDFDRLDSRISELEGILKNITPIKSNSRKIKEKRGKEIKEIIPHIT